MKKKYIIGLVAISIFVILAFLSFSQSKIEYSDFSDAKKNEKTVQIIGSVNKEKPFNYDQQANLFTFFLVDEKNVESKVTLKGPKPANFEMAPTCVVKGKYYNGDFIATEVLTKWPSKYEGQDFKQHKSQ
jgi:cytochrome c-type biogenesis protein CcmE